MNDENKITVYYENLTMDALQLLLFIRGLEPPLKMSQFKRYDKNIQKTQELIEELIKHYFLHLSNRQLSVNNII